jgi:hypothetical protein
MEMPNKNKSAEGTKFESKSDTRSEGSNTRPRGNLKNEITSNTNSSASNLNSNTMDTFDTKKETDLISDKKSRASSKNMKQNLNASNNTSSLKNRKASFNNIDNKPKKKVKFKQTLVEIVEIQSFKNLGNEEEDNSKVNNKSKIGCQCIIF